MPNHTLHMRTGEFTGHWWIPESPGMTAPGALTLTQEGRPKVLLSGPIVPVGDELSVLKGIFGEERAIGVVHGHTTRGDDITLGDTRLTLGQMEFGRPGEATYQLTAAAAYVGAHINPPVTRFDRLFLSVEHLVDWVGAGGFSVEAQPSFSKLRRLQVTGDVPEKTVAVLPDAEIAIASTLAGSSSGRTTYTTTFDAGLEVSVTRGLTTEEWFDQYVGPLSRLVSFAAGRSLVATEVILRATSPEAQVEVVWPHALNESDTKSPIGPADLLFWLADLGTDPSPGFAAWLSTCSLYAPVLDAFFATRRGRMFEEDRFSNLMQAAEGYHRRKVGGRPNEPGHDARLAMILKAAPEAHRGWLERALEHSGEYQLSARVADLVRLHPWLVGDAIPNGVKRWSGKVAAERNLRVHHDPDALPVAGSTWGLLGLTQRMSVILEACLLSELGFDEDRVQEMVRRASQPYRVLKLNDL